MKSESKLEKIFSEGKLAVTAELGPPKDVNVDNVRKKAEILKDFVDAVNVTDNQTAIVRMSSLAVSSLLVGMGLNPVMQIVCRDRNRIAIQSDVIGAAGLGINTILCLTGDHQSFGNHPGSKNVFDMDSIQLVKMLDGMRNGKFQCGEEIKNPPQIFIGAAENPFGDPFEFRAKRLAKKINAGADFIQTQCIFDIDRFERWMTEVRDMGLHERTSIMAGITPLKSFKMADYMNSSVSGITVPEETLTRMKNAKDAKAEGVKIAVESIDRIRKIEGVKGIHIMAVAWEEIVPEIVKQAGLK